MRTNKRLIVAVLLVMTAPALAGCTDNGGTGEKQAKELASDTGQNISNVQIGGSYWYEVKMTEKNQLGLVQAQPPFIMDHSLERANLIRRYQYLNDRSNLHHVYMLSEDGKVIAYRVAQGKVSSVNSKLTNDKQIVKVPNCDWDGSGGSEGSCYKTVESPQMDGSYGTNGDAIFFFTPDGDYVEYNGIYVVSEEPMNIQTKVTLVDEVNEDGDKGEADYKGTDNETDTNGTATNETTTNASAVSGTPVLPEVGA